MNQYQEIPRDGGQLGYEAAGHIARIAEEYCARQRECLELTNEPRINELHVEGHELVRRERELQERLRLAAPPGSSRTNRQRMAFCWIIGIILTVIAFFFALLSFEPFRLGWTGKLVCIGIALITPYAVEEFLEAWKSQKLFKGIITVVFVSAVTAGALLAGVRADLLAHQVQETAPAVVIDGEHAAPAESPNSFYEETSNSLRLLMVLLALAIDLGAGVAIHRALQLGNGSGEDHQTLSKELAEVRARLGEIVSELTGLANAPDLFESSFWRDFYRTMLTLSARTAATKFLGFLLFLILLAGGRAFGHERLNLVVAVDLTASEAVAGHDQRTQFQKNIDGVGRLLGSVPANSRVTVIGITESSFANPYILLSAQISDDPGYFGERLSAARQQIIRAWQRQAANLQPNAKNSDIFGALLVASEIFLQGSGRKVLVLFSDMRHVDRELDLERPVVINMRSALETAQQHHLIADLEGITVYVFGADASNRQISQWESLRQFWSGYFAHAGATLEDYSALDGSLNLDR